MDPTTTLFTFMLETHPSVLAVYLLGSWDNFSKPYAMERDVRRDRGQWRGCHSFKDIICDGDDGYSAGRDGGLKMGQTYYYYYEVDGSTETHDPISPATNQCPFLPGQTVNTLWVPVERSSRRRSASLNSVRGTDLKTMNPSDRFTTPRPALSPLANMAVRHVTTASPSVIRHKRSARSLSPNSSWSFSPRKLFSRKASSSSLREMDGSTPHDVPSHILSEDVTSVRPPTRDGSRSRDISPDSLRRLLSDDTQFAAEPEVDERLALAIPEDIAEETEDDDNFATSATSESHHFTILSPPPSQHSQSRSTTPMPSLGDGNHTTATQQPAVTESTTVEPPTRAPPDIPDFAKAELPVSRSEDSFMISTIVTPASPESTASNELPSFYHSDDEDDEEEDDGYQLPPLDAKGAGDTERYSARFSKALSTYSLPLTSDPADKLVAEQSAATTEPASPALVSRDGGDAPPPGNNASLLSSPIPNSGLDGLMSELGWIIGRA